VSGIVTPAADFPAHGLGPRNANLSNQYPRAAMVSAAMLIICLNALRQN
jgi:hypothetical protein